MWFSSIRRWLVNALIGAIVLAVLVDTCPQSPAALHRTITPTLMRLGISQGAWNLFAPEPDRANGRVRAEIVYRDGERRQWRGTDWEAASAWEKWVGHRRLEWDDHIASQKGGRVFEPWCRRIAREARPDFSDADQGAEVRVIMEEALIPSAEERPWKSFRERPAFSESWVLTIENLE